MGVYTVVFSVVLIPLVISFEVFRKKEKIFDFLTLINIVFVLAFAISPLYLYFFEAHTTWVTITRTSIYEKEFLYGEILAILFYLTTITSYYFTNKLRFVSGLKRKSERIYSKINNSHFFRVSMMLYIIGGLSLVVYINIVGGFDEFLRVGSILRDNGDYIQHPLMFLKHFTSLLCVASFMFYSLIKESKGLTKFLVVLLFLSAFFGGSLSVFHSSGRMQVFIFIITIPLAVMVYKNRLKVKTLLISLILFLFLVAFGDDLLNINNQQTIKVDKTAVEIAGEIIQEFSFPYTNLGNILQVYPHSESFRGGVLDVVSAGMQLIPRRIISFDFLERESASDYNTSLYINKITGEIPVDIVTFGYMSFGVAGVLLLAIFFGFFAKVVESMFWYTNSMIASVFYVSWMILFGFRVMYGDPEHFVYSSFRYFVAMVLIAILVIAPRKRIVWSAKTSRAV